MKTKILLVIILILIIALFITNKKVVIIPFSNTVTLIAVEDTSGGVLTGGNSQYYNVSIKASSSLGTSMITIVYDTWAVVPNPVVEERKIEQTITINQGENLIGKLVIGKITKVLVNGKEIPFKQK